MKQLLSLAITLFLLNSTVEAKEVLDMSDPLAVYTQAGIGATNKGLNVKIGISYSTGIKDVAAMNLIELKGLLGDDLGWDRPSKKSNRMDSFRFRNFSANIKSGRGSQLDINYSLKESFLAERTGNASYSILQALPKFWIVNLYPLAGIGVEFGKNTVEDDSSIDSGFSVIGFNSVVGFYGKFTITDKIWLNYNPIWAAALAGSDLYETSGYGGKDNILLHEFAASYQFTPRFNLRYFANWSNLVDIADGDHRIEFNYQF
ncbi:hypothetical protein M902_0852 [Bacteriovorax sp. BAL6_X]|uniref:hypothetical protein n=1 Tax=Bacteriovorax sp. BAL6_X TaxID=1201290 RepID=UPI0003865F97|nr:hypothetical protein [Bacteriovorax sp. BAL6_X]EPZ50175.1 hypothetical protein M902_0852 [Bacteriovorax sp. BAL6_X]